MICVVCQQRDTDRSQVCDPCITRIAAHLREVVELYDQLPAVVLPGRRGSNGRVSGTQEAAAPLNLDAVDLTLSATTQDVSDLYGDQTGHKPTAAVLYTWCRDWGTYRAQREHVRSLTVYALASWLADRLDWACRNHPAIDDFAAEIARLWSTLRGVLGRIDQPHYHHGVPCPHCESLALYRTNGEAYTTCGVCGKLLSDQELAEWSRELTSEGAEL